MHIDVNIKQQVVEVSTKGLQGVQGPSGLCSVTTFITDLNSGVENQLITFPTILNTIPEGISCEMENNVDYLIYSYGISRVTTSGFNINFSDTLSSNGYKLYSTVNL